MNKQLELKLSRFSDVISKKGDSNLIEFWNEIIDEISNSSIDSENDMNEFNISILTEKLAKVQTYAALKNRDDSEFAKKFDILSIFNKSDEYYNYMQKALNYDLRNKIPYTHKKRTLEERKKRLANFRGIVGKYLEDYV